MGTIKDEAKRSLVRSLLFGPLGFLVTCCVAGGLFVVFGGGGNQADGTADRSAPRPTAAGPVSLCGSSAASQGAHQLSGWSRWSCRSEDDVSDWDRCLPRSRYALEAGQGCPGEQRCCPPDSASGAE